MASGKGSAAYQKWRRQVLERVRFWPDRCAIGEELDAHFDDHVADLERIGYDAALAADRALGAMGEPEALGRAFDAVHRPLWGWLWEVSRLALWAALAVLALGLANFGFTGLNQWLSPEVPAVTEYDYPEIGAVNCPAPVEMGSYTITVAEARYYRLRDGGEGKLTLTDNSTMNLLELTVTAETPKFWLDGPALHDVLEAVDSAGDRYTAYGYPNIAGYGAGGHGKSVGTVMLRGFRQNPEWVEISHQTAGWTLHIDLPAGEEASS